MMDNNKPKCDQINNQVPPKVEDADKREFLKKCNTYSKPVITLLFVGSTATTELNAASKSDDGF